MISEQFELFLILLKLRSYLVSLIDHPSEGKDSLAITEEFLERKYPERKAEVLELFSLHKINSDSQIAFDEKIHLRFKEIIKESVKSFQLSNILEKFQIESVDETIKEKTVEELRLAREQKLKEIVSVLLQLARIWTQRSDLENDVDDFSVLEEEDLIRPEEIMQLGKLGSDTNTSYKAIAKITHLYLEHLVEYYFKFGGDIVLSDFIKGLDEFKILLQSKYNDLFKQSGLDANQKSGTL